MRYYITPLLLIGALLLSASLPAQDIFSLLSNSQAANEAELVQEGTAWTKANDIFQRLLAAKGDQRLTPPPFYMATSEDHLAFMDPEGLSIALENKAFNILSQYEDGPLAYLLAHELIHYYDNHAYQMSVFNFYEDPYLAEALKEAKEKLPSNDDYQALAKAVEKSRKRLAKVTIETEADYLGGFLAYTAGFEVPRMSPIIDKLYTEYNLGNEVFGYLAKQERMRMADESYEKIQEFIDVFEVANLLVAVNRYSDARILYKYILQQYQSREMYNNLGVLTVLDALQYVDPADKKYRLPLELDLDFNIGTRDASDPAVLRQRLLEEALAYFTSATSLDPSYAPAYLNLACVYYLQKDDARAKFYAGVEAKEKAGSQAGRFPNTATNADVLLALIDLRAGVPNAVDQLKALADRKSPIAKENYHIATGTRAPEEDNFADYEIDWTIDGLKRRDILTETQDALKAKTVRVFEEAKFQYWTRDNAKIYRFSPPKRERRPKISFLITNPGYSQTTPDGFGVGSPGEKIEARFAKPTRKLTTVSGEIWVYPTAILMMDGQNKLRRWVLID